ncbi:hypothetical protein [Methylovirgula sp. 4M-Z18]|uniref:hypothetical protein n=1 Tax=Methylovirgula sp. 4M-Z18 TaxID=2293567 RepID=UPI000E2FB360|nr:hypothetical protein [Methylovirgula sp. 4M-Z18]
MQTQESRVQRINMYNQPNGEAGLLASGNRGGTPKVAADLRPDDTIKINGLETSLAVAERLGLVKRAPNGGYENASQEQVQNVVAPQQQAEVDPREADPHYNQALHDVPATEALHDLVSNVTAGTQTRALLDAVKNDGVVSFNTLAAAASEAGKEPSQVQEQVSHVLRAFRAQAASVASDHGVPDAERFFAWARENRAGQLQGAMLAHGQRRTTSGYVPLIQDYLERLDEIAPEAVLGSHVPGRPDIKIYKKDGKVLVSAPGRGEMTWKSALRTGLVKLGK